MVIHEIEQKFFCHVSDRIVALHPSSICTSYAPNTLKTHTTIRVTSYLTTGYGCADGLPSGKPSIARAATSLAQRSTRPTTCLKSSHSLLDIRSSTPDLMPSYLILDEYMRFLDKGIGNKSSPSILEVGVNVALRWVFWDQKGFVERGGFYDWTREKGTEEKTSLDW